MQGEDSEPGESKGADESRSTQSKKNALHSGETDSRKILGVDAVSALWTFGKCLGYLLPVYFAGYYRVSTSLVVFGMMVYTGWKLSREAKEARLRSAIQLQDNEQEYMSMNVFKSKRDLPAWVNFPDVEKVEWLNKVLQQVWPFVGQYLEKLLVETIAPSIRGSSSHLQTLEFTKVDFGDKAMKVVGIKAHTENDKGQVLLDLYISYVGNVEINVEVKRYFCKAGVKGIQLHGMMRVILEPLIGDVPIVGAVTMFFIKRPKLDINWTGMTNLLDIPGLNVMSDSMIMDAIASFLVLPNRLTVPLVPDLHVAQLRSPLPRGVVRIHLLEAADLAAKDNYIKGVIAGMSDPYAILRVGPQTFTSHHVDNTSCPKWEEMYEVIVHEVPGQELEIEVYDKDTDQDDFLGRAKLDLGIVKKSRVVDEWFTLKDTPTGRVHLRLEWLALLPSTERLEQVLQRNERVVVSSKTTDPPSAAILAVYLDKAEALPMKKGNKDPSPMVQLSVQDITRESRTCYTTVNPEWEDAFTFFIQDPHKQDIDIQVKDVDRVQSLGSLSIPLSRLLSSPSLSLDQWFQLDKSGPASRVYINAVLRVLWLDEESIPESVSSDLASDPSKDLPQHSSPDPSFATEGLLRIHLVKGQNLVPKDNLMGGMVKGKSDPYAVINIGGGTFTSAVVKGNLNPTWNEMYEVVLTKLPGQELQLELFDKDMDMKDDFMGRLKISLTDIISSHYTDQWYTLNDVKSGRVQLVLEWLSTVSEPERLDQVLHFHSRESYSNKAVPSTGLLFVYVDRAQGLALKKSGKEPKVGVELTLGKQSHKTTVCDRTISPQWDEAFYFLVRDPSKEMLVVKLSHCWTLAMGSVAIPLRELLSEEELVLDQWLNLDGGSPQSQVLLRVQLKVLSPKMCPGATEKSKAAIVPEPSAAPPKQEKDTVQRSTSVDRPGDPIPAPPSVPLPKEAVVEESAPGIVHEEVKKAPPPAPDPTPAPPTPRPPHTSPSAGFAREGVLRILLLEAHKLIAKDNLMGGMVKGKSDPYAKIAVGDAHFKSLVVKENLSPVWNEMYEVALVPHPGQEVQVEVYDKDMDKDDFLGRFKVRMEEIIESQYTDKWFTLNDVKSGGVHLVLEWVPTVTEPGQLEPVLQLQSLQAYTNKAVPSSAILFVYLERASSLPLKKSGKEPRAGAELVLGGTTHRTKVCDRSTAPRWDEAFHFLIRDPTTETLVIKLSSGWDEPIGSLVVSMRELLSKPQLVLDQWLNLDGAAPQSQVLLRAQLKILHTKMTEGLEELQGTVTGPEEEEEEEEELHAPQTVTAAVEEEPLSVGSPAAPSQPSAGHPEETEPAVETLWEEPRHPDTDPTHVKPPPSPGDQVAEPTESELSPTPTAQPVTATNDELQPSAGLGDLVQATVTSLPPVSVSEHAGVDPGEVQKVAAPVEHKPLHTTPTKGFGSEGVLRIHLLEAQNLVAKDNLMGGMVKGKSDPYVKVSVGDAKFKSHVIKENLNPTWNEMYELVLREPAPQEVQFEVYDKDLDSDDFLGRFSIRLADVIRCRYTDEWYTLREVKSGRVHLVLEWVPTVSEPVRLDKVMQLQSLQSFRNRTAPSAALLWVFLQSARSLPLKKSGKEPKAGAELVVGETTHRTKVCERSTSPQWNETFHFLVRDPKQEMLIIKLSSAWDQAMGALVVPVRELLSKPELVLDQWLNLDGASPQSQILLRAQLKILDSKMADLIDVGAVPCAASSGGSGNGQVKLSVKHGSKERRLTITVHACRGLLSPSKDPIDSYVSVMLLPDKSKATKKKTSVKKRDLNPEYNEKFEYEVSLEEAKCKCLSVTVKNSSASFRSRDLIGQVQMELAQIDLVSGVTDWFDLQDED